MKTINKVAVLFYLDTDGKIVDLSETAKKFWPNSLGKNFFETIVANDEEIRRGFFKVLNDFSCWQGGFTPDEGRYVSVIINNRGANQTIVVELTRQNYEPQATPSKRNISDTSQERMKLLTRISHNLRTPLSIIHSGLQLLEMQNEIKGENKELIQALLSETNRFDRMINKVLWSSRVNNGYSLECSEIDLDRFFSEIQKRTEKQMEHKIAIKNKLDSFPKLQANEGALVEIMSNLLENAVSFCPDGKIWIELDADKTHILITVCDEGSGIKPEAMPRIFDLYYTDGNRNGSGLGLNIVKNLVEMMGGYVEILNPKVGAKVRIALKRD